MKTEIVVTSSSHLPRFCAGTSFSGACSYPLDYFNEEQLYELLADRFLTVVVGRQLLPQDVKEFYEHASAHVALYGAAPLEEAPATVAGATSEVVSGLAVYPAGSQAAVLPAAGETVVDPATAGGVVTGAAEAVPPVVVKAVHHGRGHKGG